MKFYSCNQVKGVERLAWNQRAYADVLTIEYSNYHKLCAMDLSNCYCLDGDISHIYRITSSVLD